MTKYSHSLTLFLGSSTKFKLNYGFINVCRMQINV